MPSRQFPTPLEPPAPPIHHRHSDRRIVPPLAGGITAAFSLLLLLSLCFRKLTRKRTVPASSSDSDSKPLHRFSYSSLRRATCSFSPSNRLGQGGFGSVYRGAIPFSPHPELQVAVKLMDSGSLQGEREFQNELFLAGRIDSNFVVSLIGFSSDPKRRRMLLVYELMANGSLQDCLLHRKCIELRDWKRRFSIALDIASGLEYLHHHCDPPVIHGDIKPSNILLDSSFGAKIGDFGLARLKSSEDQCEIEVKESHNCSAVEGTGSVVEEAESVVTATATAFKFGVHQSPESFDRVYVGTSPETVGAAELSPETVVSPRTIAGMVSPTDGLEKTSLSDGNFDRASMDSGKEMVNGIGKKSGRRKGSISGKDWWWKQDNGGADSEKVKDYVMEWIGNEIKKERPRNDFIGPSSSSGTVMKVDKKKKKKKKKRLDWWVSMDDDKDIKKEKRRPAREWWKEEYCEELSRKKKQKKKQGNGCMSDDNCGDNWWPRDEELGVVRKKRSRRRGSRGSIDWWLDGLSGELWRARGNSHDSLSGEITKSGGISSTPSMRGTICYIAPEYGGGGDLSEKCDVYSFGVLLLVLIAGRRPLQVTGSPMSEFQRANLLSWARHLARAGKLLELVDKSIESLDKEQALLCITVALLCLQKSPARRPPMREVLMFLCGDLDPPQLPVEYSPSPPSRVPFKSHHKKVRTVRDFPS